MPSVFTSGGQGCILQAPLQLSLVYLFIVFKGSVQRVTYIVFEGLVKVLDVPLGISEEQRSTGIGKA